MIVVTLTTIPTRLVNEYHGDQGMISSIKSLINQTYSDYKIYLNIPKVFKLTGEEYIIPEWLLNLANTEDKLELYTGLEDLGPSTKLIPTIRRITNPEDLIIVVDDDVVYHPEMVKEHVKNQSNFSEAVVGYDGMRSKDNLFGDVRDYYHSGTRRTSRVDILQHYKSVSYKRRYFEDDFEQFINENFTWEDDLLLSAYFAYKKRDRIVTYHESDPELTLEEWQTRGGVWTFPFEKHTNHDTQEGCNIYRGDNDKANLFITNENLNLWQFIDNGYK